MKKLAANYVLSNSGHLLKNGILIADNCGNVKEIIDTKGDLDEMALLTFHNGILMANNLYIRKNTESIDENDELVQFINLKIGGFQQLTSSEIIEVAKQTQAEFPKMKIPEISIAIFSLLNSCFYNKEQPGIFFLVNSNLIGLHFKPQTMLKRIL